MFIFLFICFIDKVKALTWDWESEYPITNTSVIHNNPITCSMDWQTGGSSIFSTGRNFTFTMKLYRYASADADADDYLSVSTVTREFSNYLSYYDEHPILFEFNAPIAWLGDYYYLCQLEWTGYISPYGSSTYYEGSTYGGTKTKVSVNNGRVAFHPGTNQHSGGTINGSSSTVYRYTKALSEYVYSTIQGTTKSSVPLAVKPGYQFLGYYTSASGGTQVLNSTGGFSNTYGVSGYTTYAGRPVWVGNQNIILYAQYSDTPITYSVYFNNGFGSTASTPSLYYKYNYRKSISSSSYCRFFTDSTLETCTQTRGSDSYGIPTTPTKTNYSFQGYFSSPNGAGTRFIDSTGNINNNLYQYSNNNNSNVTLYANWSIDSPNTPTISGAATKVYNSSSTTLTCSETKTYSASGITLYYSFGYATSDGGTPSNWTTDSTTNTYVIPQDEAVGQKWWSCRVYAKDSNGYTSSTVKSATTADAEVTINNAKITFNVSSNSGTISGTSPLYSKYGVSGMYTGIRNTTSATIPTATRTGYTFQGWYTAASGGSKVINADKSIVASVSNWTNASKQFLRTANSTLYAQFSINTYTITLNNQSATTAGTTTVYYKYNTSTPCYYYTDSTLETCLTDYTITAPVKTGYTFKGYYSETSGGGTQYVNANGVFVNNIYKKAPSEINSSYTDTITLYAYWEAKPKLIYDYQVNQTFEGTGDSFFDTDYIVDWSKDFEIHETFRISELGKNYLLVGNRGSGTVLRSPNIEINSENKLVVRHCASGTCSSNSKSGTLVANEDINLTFIWNPSSKKYSVSIRGTQTNISFTAVKDSFTGTMPYSLRLAKDRTSNFSPLEIKAFSIVEYVDPGTVLLLNDTPRPYEKTSSVDVWYNDATAGSRISQLTINSDQTIYAHYNELYKVEFNPGSNYTTAGITSLYYIYKGSKIVNGSECRFFTNYDAKTCVTSPINMPTKTGYTFNGYNSEQGAGYIFVEADGSLKTSNFYYNKPSDINSSYTDTLTLYADFIIDAPATPTINRTGDADKVYGSTETTLTCINNTTYASGTTLQYEFTYNSNWSEWSTSNTLVISSTEYVGTRNYSCRVRAVGGGYNSGISTSASDAKAEVTYSNAAILFDATTNGGSSNTTLYAKYGTTNLYTAPRNTTSESVPLPTKSSYTFDGWYTAASGGTKVINSARQVTANVSNWTDTSKNWQRTDNNGVLYAQFLINNPATPTITRTGDAARVYNSSDTTLTCATSTNYPNTVTKYYQFGYAQSDGGTSITWLGTASTTATYTVSKTEYVGQRWYSCRVYVTDGTTTSSTVASATASDAEVTYNNAAILFDATTNGGSSNTTLYSKFGVASLYTEVRNTTVATVPTPTKANYRFDGWYTASSGGTKVINVDGTVVASVNNWTNSSKQWQRTDNQGVLYAQFLPVYSITLDSGGATTPGTTTLYYSKNYVVQVNSANCYYFTDSSLTNCLTGSKIESPSKANYIFDGYYTEPNGSGTNHVNASGIFINNLYKKAPNEVNSSYTDNVILYAKWIEPNGLIYDYQINKSFTGSSDSYYDTGYIVDWTKDFEIEETINIAELNKSYLLFGSYDTTNTSANFIQLVANSSNNKVRLYLGSLNSYKESTSAIVANENINVKFSWNSTNKAYGLRLKGTETDITVEGTNNTLTGSCANSIRLGVDRGRASGYWYPIDISSFRITEKLEYGSVVNSFPTYKNNDYVLEWYNAQTDGTLTTSVTLDESKVLYAHNVPIYSVTLDNGDSTVEGTTKYYYEYKVSKTINDTTCYYYTDNALENCITSITIPEKDDNHFGGYYVRANGEGMPYITSSGSFTNSLYLKEPPEIDSSYTTDITLYAKWSLNEYITYNFQNNDSFDGTLTSFFNTGYYVNFDRDFEIEETFRISELDIPHLIIGSFNLSASSSKFFQLAVQSDNVIRVYMGKTSVYKDSEETVSANEDINLKFSWDADTQTYTLTAKGTNTDITMTDTVAITGKSVRELRLGADRGRNSAYYGPIDVSNLKITNEEDYGTVLTSLPKSAKEGYSVGWYDEPTGGNKVDSVTVDEDKTLYAHWVEQRELTYDYQINGEYGTTPESYFNTGYDINWDKDFKIEETFRISELDQRNLIVGSFYSSSVKKTLNLEVRNNKIRVYIVGDSTTSDNSSTDTININEDIDLVFNWDAASETYTLTATGTNTNISMTSTAGVSGKSPRILRIGQDNRQTAAFSSISVSNFKIIATEDINSTVTSLPVTSVDDATLIWYDASTGGNKVTSLSMNTDKAVYARWIEQNTLTYNYVFTEPFLFDGTDFSYYDTDYTIDWGKSFEIEETIKLPKLGERYLIFGTYEKNYENCIDVEISKDNRIRVTGYGVGDYAQDLYYEGTLAANEDINFKFTWDAGKQFYDITLEGDNTEFTIHNAITGVVGTTTKTVRLGQDHRGYSVYKPMEFKSLNISTSEIENSVVTNFPVLEKLGNEFNWYDEPTGGNTVTSVSLDSDKVLYGRFIPNKYSIVFSSDATDSGTTRVYYEYNSFKEISNENCYYYTDSDVTTCIIDNKIEIPSKTGYEFEGYYSEASGEGTKYINSLGEFVIDLYNKLPSEINAEYTDEITLYANWEPIEILVTLPDDTIEVHHYNDTYTLGVNDVAKANSNGAAITFKYQDNETYDTTLNVIKSYTPNGWLVNDVETEDETVLTLTEPIEIEYNYTEIKTSPEFPTPTRDNYTFQGWYDLEENGELVESYNGDDDIDLYAHWLGDEINVTLPDDTVEVHHYGDTYELGTNDVAKANSNGAEITFKYQDNETSDTTEYVIISYIPTGWLVNGVETSDETVLTLTEPIEIEYNYTESKTSPEFPEPTREHYVFEGWYDASENGNLVESYIGTEDINLFAYWVGENINVTLPDDTIEIYHYNDIYELGTNDVAKANSNGAAITFKYQDNETADTIDYVIVSYTPAGWLVNDVETADETVLTLTEPIEIEYNYTESLTNPIFPEPTREDYIFDGWYESTEWLDKVTEESEITNDISLFARWIEDIRENENQCIIVKADDTTEVVEKGSTYDLGTNESTRESDVISTITFKYQDNLTADTTANVLKTYTANGWLVNDVETSNNTAITCDADMVTIRYNYTDEVVSPTFPEPTREHYELLGWYDNQTEGYVVTSYTGSEDINLFAHWLGDEINVTLPDNTVEVHHYGETYDLGTNVEPKANTNKAEISFDYQDGVTANTTLYVETSYTPSGWLVNGNEETDNTILTLTEPIEIDYNYSETLINPTFPEPEREDYIFDGWYESTEWFDRVTEETEISEDITLYAHWIEDIRENENQCIIVKADDTTEVVEKGSTYELGTNNNTRESDIISTITFKYQDNLTAYTEENVLRTYTPSGWLVDDVEISDNETVTCNADMLIIRSNYEDTLISPDFPEPTREHYVFDGWYDAESEGNLLDSYTGTENINLYAYWIGEEINVTLPDDTVEVHHYGDEYTLGTNDVAKANSNGATVTFKYQDNETSDTTDYVIISYTPNGWLVNGVETADETVLTLTEPIEIEYNYTESKTSPEFPEPTRDNYTFLGWYDEEENGELVESYNGDENINLYAYWNLDKPTDFELDSYELNLVVGDNHQVEVTYIPDGTTDNLVFSGYDDEIVSVTEEGLITALSAGNTTITVALSSDNTITKDISVSVMGDKITSELLDVIDKETYKIIIGEEPNTTIDTILEKIDNSEYIKVYTKNDELVDPNDYSTELIKTGMKLKLVINEVEKDEVIVVIRGDVDGDGLVNVTDLAPVEWHILEDERDYLEGYYKDAVDLDNDDIVDVRDEGKLMKYILEDESVPTLN